MENPILLILKSESGDEYMFRLNRVLSESEIEIFVEDNLPNEYDFDEGVSYIADYQFVELNEIKKFNI